MSESDISPSTDELTAKETPEETESTTKNEPPDTHRCGKCRLDFASIEEFVKHKLHKDNCRVTYTKSQPFGRVLIPQLVQKKAKNDATAPGHESGMEKTGKRRVGRPPKRRMDPNLEQENQVEKFEPLPSYACKECSRTFTREAALKRHIQYDHAAKDDSDEEEDEAEAERQEDEVIEPSYVPEIGAEPAAKHKAVENTFLSQNSTNNKCTLCMRTFKDNAILRTHMLTHSDQRDFRCTYDGCTFAFKTKGSLKRHLRRHTGERPYKCVKCGRSFGESGALTRHLKSRVSCDLKSDNDLPRYGRRIELSGMARSSLEGVVSDVNSGLEGIQEEGGADVAMETITIGGEGEDGQNAGQEVGEVEEGEEEDTLPNQCKACKETFDSIDPLRDHLKEHLAALPFRCGLCPFATVTREQLDTHMQGQHNINVKEGKSQPKEVIVEEEEEEGEKKDDDAAAAADALVEEQEKSSEAETLLERLQENNSTESPPAEEIEEEKLRVAALAVKQLVELCESHTKGPVASGVHGYKPLNTCTICERSFRGNSYLKLHMRSHTGEKPHKCQVCMKSFSTKDTLNKHMMVHTEERQYKCGECGKLFKRISHVREHLKIHSSERPFPCYICGKSFKTANACKVHTRTHGASLPYKCKMCTRQFREKGSLDRHVRTHTGEKPYKCPHCGRGFAEHGTRNRHMKAKVGCWRYGSSKLSQPGQDVDRTAASLLAEFSSVVADTQHYIVQADNQLQTDETSQEAEIVVLSSNVEEVSAMELQNINIEVVSEDAAGNLEQTPITQQYIVINQSEDSITVMNQQTGETLSLPRTDQLNAIVAAPADMEQSQEFEAVAMVPTHEAEVITIPRKIGDVVAMLTDRQDEEMDTQIEKDGETNLMENIMIPATDAVVEQVETVAMVTGSSHDDYNEEHGGDAVQQAMLEANVVEGEIILAEKMETNS